MGFNALPTSQKFQQLFFSFWVWGCPTLDILRFINFNVRSSKWWNLNKNTPEGFDIGSSVSASGRNQIIDHITS